MTLIPWTKPLKNDTKKNPKHLLYKYLLTSDVHVLRKQASNCFTTVIFLVDAPFTPEELLLEAVQNGRIGVAKPCTAYLPFARPASQKLQTILEQHVARSPMAKHLSGQFLIGHHQNDPPLPTPASCNHQQKNTTEKARPNMPNIIKQTILILQSVSLWISSRLFFQSHPCPALPRPRARPTVSNDWRHPPRGSPDRVDSVVDGERRNPPGQTEVALRT